jgi:hypothetical protein
MTGNNQFIYSRIFAILSSVLSTMQIRGFHKAIPQLVSEASYARVMDLSERMGWGTSRKGKGDFKVATKRVTNHL